MSLHVSVQGGTGAGRKKPKKDAAPPWYCKCGTRQPHYIGWCKVCSAGKP